MINQERVIKDLWSSDKRWNEQLIKNIFYNSTDVESILKIYIPRTSRDDKKVWPYSKGGELSMKTAYKIIHGQCRDGPRSAFNYNAFLSPKELYFFITNALITQFRHANCFMTKIYPMKPYALFAQKQKNRWSMPSFYVIMLGRLGLDLTLECFHIP